MTDDKIKWSYLAGIVDGEGSLTLSAYHRSDEEQDRLRYTAVLSITNTNLDLMKWLIRNFGGVYYCKDNSGNPKWKLSYSWRPKGRRNTENLILALLPYLVIKIEQAKLFLEWIRLDGENNPTKRLALVEKMHKLNQRGSSVETNTLASGTPEMIESELYRRL